jgi:hypothetical protein
MNNFDFITNYNYYGRRPLNEDEIDDAFGLGDVAQAAAAQQQVGDVPQDTNAPQDAAPADATGTQPAEISDNAVQLDVTQLVLKQDEINKTVQDVLGKIGELLKGNESFKSELNQKFEDLENKSAETAQRVKRELEMRVPTPTEKLQLQSLHSFPYNVKLTDYWQPTQEDKYKYMVANAKTNMHDDPTFRVDVKNLPDVEKAPEEYILKSSDVTKGYDENYVKNSF